MAGMESLRTIEQLSVQTHHVAFFLGKEQGRQIRCHSVFHFHNSFGTCDQRGIQLWEGGREGDLGREVICFMFNHIPGLVWSVRLCTGQKVCNAF